MEPYQEDPPEKSFHSTWVDRLQICVDHPNQWYVVFEGSVGTATSTKFQLSRGRVKIPKGDWRWINRRGKVYAMYVLPETSHER